MIGIDIARVKRWFKKTYPQFDGVGYEIELMLLSATSVDHIGGMDATFLVNVYQDGDGIFWASGVYNRMHYGGWNCHVTQTSEDEVVPANNEEEVVPTNNEGEGTNTTSEGPGV